MLDDHPNKTSFRAARPGKGVGLGMIKTLLNDIIPVDQRIENDNNSTLVLEPEDISIG